MSRPWVKFFLKHPEGARIIMQALREEAKTIAMANGNKQAKLRVEEDLRERFEREIWGV